MLPLLRYLLSSRVKKVLMVCRFGATTSTFSFMCNENFNGIGKKLLPTKVVPIASLNLSISHWSLSSNMTSGKAAGLNWWPVRGNSGKGVCSDLNRSAQQPQMVAYQSLETMSGVILIYCDQSLQPDQLQMKCDVWKQCSDQRWQDKLQISIWRFF